jgi:hypothetical protein
MTPCVPQEQERKLQAHVAFCDCLQRRRLSIGVHRIMAVQCWAFVLLRVVLSALSESRRGKQGSLPLQLRLIGAIDGCTTRTTRRNPAGPPLRTPTAARWAPCRSCESCSAAIPWGGPYSAQGWLWMDVQSQHQPLGISGELRAPSSRRRPHAGSCHMAAICIYARST